ncbi:MAG: hypothetical protein EXR72_00820 [Myxococcales bacterium]|nr:hypothetical protein [Myxococcales bacterium]
MRHIAVALGFLAALTGCKVDKLSSRGKTPPAPANGSSLTQRFGSPNKRITARYPADFAASVPPNTNAVILARNLPGGSDEAVSLLPIENPVSHALEEFARIVHNASTGTLHKWQQTSIRRTPCNGMPGVEITGTWVDEKSGGVLFRRACAFVRNRHGYCFGYSAPQGVALEHMPLLQAIVEATEFGD